MATNTTAAPTTSKHHVRTTMNYWLDPGDGTGPKPAYIGRHERRSMPLNVTVYDIRGEEDRFTLDSHGFQLVTQPSREKCFENEQAITKGYYAEVEQLLKDATGASRVFIFDYLLRRSEPKNPDAPDESVRAPVQRVHLDQSYSAARNRVLYHLSEEGERLLQTRHQLVNVWRPIRPVLKDPLAFAASKKVPDEDLLPVAIVYPHRRGETYTVRLNEKHEWFYAYGMTPQEVMLIKIYDSKIDGRERRVPHSAFIDPTTVNEAPVKVLRFARWCFMKMTRQNELRHGSFSLHLGARWTMNGNM